MREEVVEAAFETNLTFDLLHLGADPRDFFHADGVDFVGSERGRGVVAGEEVVIGLAVRQIRYCDAGAGVRQILVVEIGLQRSVRRHDLLCDHVARLGLQRCALRLGHIAYELCERPIERAGRRVVDDLRGDLRRHPLHQNARGHVAGFHALAHQCDGLIDHCGQCAHPRQPVAIVADCVERQAFDDAVRVLHPALMGDGLQILAKALSLHGFVLQPQKGVVIELIGSAELSALESLQLRKRFAVCRFACGDGFEAAVGPAVVVAAVAVERGRFRILAQAPLPLFGEKLVQSLAFVGRLDLDLALPSRLLLSMHQ